MIYRAEIIEKNKDPKKPEAIYFFSKGNIVDAAIEATKKMNAEKAGKEWRVYRVEELPSGKQ